MQLDTLLANSKFILCPGIPEYEECVCFQTKNLREWTLPHQCRNSSQCFQWHKPSNVQLSADPPLFDLCTNCKTLYRYLQAIKKHEVASSPFHISQKKAFGYWLKIRKNLLLIFWQDASAINSQNIWPVPIWKQRTLLSFMQKLAENSLKKDKTLPHNLVIVDFAILNMWVVSIHLCSISCLYPVTNCLWGSQKNGNFQFPSNSTLKVFTSFMSFTCSKAIRCDDGGKACSKEDGSIQQGNIDFWHSSSNSRVSCWCHFHKCLDSTAHAYARTIQ